MIKIIKINREIDEDNLLCAERIKSISKKNKCFIINIMGSPGCGKTTFILEIIKNFLPQKTLVVEGDVDSTVDSEKIISEGFSSIQIQTGGACHLDASMVESSLNNNDFEKYDFIIIENIGNLICTSSQDIGADLNIVLLSIPEGDDKPLKYPSIFKFADATVVTKSDYLSISDFNLDSFKKYISKLNEDPKVFITSSKEKSGFNELLNFFHNSAHNL